MSETLNAVDTALLETIADMPKGEAKGAVNIRKDSGCASRVTTENIDIKTKEDKPGIDIIIKPGTKKETCHIPVIITKSGLTHPVYNDFYVGEDAEVTITQLAMGEEELTDLFGETFLCHPTQLTIIGDFQTHLTITFGVYIFHSAHPPYHIVW